MGNIVECIKRIYKIQTSNGIKMEIESEKPLSGITTAKLLEDDNEIGCFLENCKILDVEIPQEKMFVKPYKNRSKRKLKKKNKKTFLPKERSEIPDQNIQEEEIQKDRITPCDRINVMLTMEGEFTRVDYQKVMEEKGHKMSNFMGHEDIETAILLRRIEQTGEKIGRGLRKYRIIDAMPVEDYMFRKILKNHREKMKY